MQCQLEQLLVCTSMSSVPCAIKNWRREADTLMMYVRAHLEVPAPRVIQEFHLLQRQGAAPLDIQGVKPQTADSVAMGLRMARLELWP